MSDKKTNQYFGGGSAENWTENGAGYESGYKACGCNNGVTCEVTSCVHHCEGQKCDADVIHVGNTSANTRYDTRCDTYKEKGSF